MNKVEYRKKMYVDYSINPKVVEIIFEDKVRKYLIRDDGKLNSVTLVKCADIIKNIAKLNNFEICIDSNGCGMLLYDLLKANQDIIVKKLKFI